MGEDVKQVRGQHGGAKPAVDIITRVHELRHMSLEELRAEHAKVFGTPSKSRSRQALFVKIAKRVQEDALRSKAEGELPKPTLVATFEGKLKARSRNVTKVAGKKKGARAGKKTRVKPIGRRDPRLPKQGTSLVREWHGKRYVVTVEQEGFTYANKSFRSLSAVAKAICNQVVNGYSWFKLGAKEPQES